MALERSFTHLGNAMAKTGAGNLADKVNMFGQQAPMHDLWILTTTHLHEHLGQFIACAQQRRETAMEPISTEATKQRSREATKQRPAIGGVVSQSFPRCSRR